METKKSRITYPEKTLRSVPNTSGADEAEDRIKAMIREMRQAEPPAGLLPAVMNAVKARNVPLWMRAYRWVRSPRSVTFNLLHLASGVALCALLLVFSTFFLQEKEGRNIALSQSGLIPVVFALDTPDARSVQVMGSFNNWVPQPCSLHRDKGSNRWVLTLRLQPGRYEYAFLVDGKHVPDPDAQFHKDDGFGNKNTLLALGQEDDI